MALFLAASATDSASNGPCSYNAATWSLPRVGPALASSLNSVHVWHQVQAAFPAPAAVVHVHGLF